MTLKIKLKNIAAALLASLSILATWSCTGNNASTASLLHEADSLADASEYSSAKEICNELMKREADMSASELGHLAILFISLTEADDVPDPTDDISSATACYLKAFEKDPTEAMEFFNSLSTDSERRMASVLGFLARPVMGLPVDNISEEDSIDMASADSIASSAS